MKEITFIDLKKCILEDNDNLANEIRALCKTKNIFLWNIMSSPGSGKTTFIKSIINLLKDKIKIGVIEGDIESTCDSKKISETGVEVVQLRTGGSCHLDASNVKKAMEELPLDTLDLIIIENIGNLVCPAEFDLGADLDSMILSVPEGDDKIIKYPLMFTVTNALIVSKIDVKDYFDFDLELLKKNAYAVNKDLKIFPLSAKTGVGVSEFIDYLEKLIKENNYEKQN